MIIFVHFYFPFSVHCYIIIYIQSSKRRRSSTKAINFRVPNEVYNEFIKKVDETGLDRDKILLEMIKEWID